MLGPLLGRVAIHSWRQGGTAWSLLVAQKKTNGWDASTSAKSERDGDGIWMMKALGLWREVRHVAMSGLAGRFGGSSKTAPELDFGSFHKTAPVKIPEGRVATSGRLRRVEANFSKSS